MLKNKMVYICSPLKGDIDGNIKKALNWVAEAACVPGILPIAPHTYFTLFLDDTIQSERKKGLALGIGLLKKSDEVWVHGNTLSQGMISEIILASNLGIPIIPKYMDRSLYKDLMTFQQVFKESFKDEQWEEICKGLEAGFDVSKYTQPSLSVGEMRNMRLSMEWDNIDDHINGYANEASEDGWEREA